MKELSGSATIDLLMDTPLPKVKARQCTGLYDYGDPATVGKCLKRPDPKGTPPFFMAFGRFHGRVVIDEIGYYLAVVVDVRGNILAGELFETIDECKARWELD